jgi:hypothetical protein
MKIPCINVFEKMGKKGIFKSRTSGPIVSSVLFSRFENLIL